MKNRKLWLYLAVAGFISVALLGGVVNVRLSGRPFVNAAAHATIDAAGAVAAILTAVFLLQREREALGGKTLFIALGFLGMGLLEGFHAASPPGASFILLNNMAMLVGGALFALTWVPRAERLERYMGLMVIAVTAACVFFGLWAHTSGETLPVMLKGVEFTPLSKGMNLLAAALFIAAAARLLLVFYHTGDRDSYVFACMALLLGVVGFTFDYSRLWDGTWWFWHSLRLTAYSLVLAWVVGRYRHKRREAEEEALERSRHIALGADVGKALVISSNLREALQGCAEAIVRHLDAAFARIWILNEKDEVLELFASAGMYTNTDGFHSRLHLFKYPYKIAVIARDRTPHLTNSVIGDPMIHDQEWAKREGMVAFAGYPLVFKDRLVGVVGMFAKKRLSPAALGALEFIADEITVGIERMRSAEALKKSEERLRTVVEESLAGVHIIQDGKLQYINQAMADIYGYSIDEVSEIWLEGVCLAEDRPRDAELNGKLMSGELKNLRYEARRCRKDGSVVYLDILRWMTEYEGRPAIIGTALDITDRKRMETALRESESKFRSFSEEAGVGIFLIQDFRYAYVNPELCGMLGYSEAELARIENILELTHPEDREYARDGIANILAGSLESARFQSRWIKKDGGVMDVEGTAALTVYKGRTAVIGTALDVTERKVLEREKMDFLAMVTHDFKSPLTNILGYSELLVEKNMGSETAEMAGAIMKSGEKLSRMVEDFIFRARLETGAAIPDMSPGDLKELLNELCGEYALQAERKGLLFSLDMPSALTMVPFDRKLLERAISNVLQNALTYTPEGGRVTVKAERLVLADEEFAVVSISDTGPGIPREMQHKVFDKYVRSAGSAGTRGTGLGLAVVKLVVDAHQGKAEVDCPPGAGCTFRIALPFKQAREKKAA